GTGAGAVNWISMYAQSDIQRNREYYFLGPPYDNFEHYWNISPLKYIKNAKTPTLIHVVSGDPRVPRPQSEELHMALKKLGVPTEFIVYAGNSHGIPDMRGPMVKMVSEFKWFEKWINGKLGRFEVQDEVQYQKTDKPTENEGKPESTTAHNHERAGAVVAPVSIKSRSLLGPVMGRRGAVVSSALPTFLGPHAS